jgi:uncharacterized membrane protein
MVRVKAKKRVIGLLAFFVIFLLLASFGLHSIQIPHSHGGTQSHEQTTETDSSVFVSLAEYMHSAEKKVLFFIPSALVVSEEVLALLYGTWSLFLTFIAYFLALQLRRVIVATLRIENYTALIFAKGILNPKLY